MGDPVKEAVNTLIIQVVKKIIRSLGFTWIHEKISFLLSQKNKKKYLKKIHIQYKDLKKTSFSIRSPDSYRIDDMFIPPKLQFQTVENINPELEQEESAGLNDHYFTIFDIITKMVKDQVSPIIVASSGYGKTLLCQYIAFLLSGKKKIRKKHGLKFMIPFYIPLKKQNYIDEIINNENIRLEQVIQMNLKEEFNLTGKWIRNELDKYLVFFDGFQNIVGKGDKEKIIRWINKQRDLHRTCHFIVTSRPEKCLRNLVDRAIELKILPFDNEQVKGFILQWHVLNEKNSKWLDKKKRKVSAKEKAKNLLAIIDKEYSLRLLSRKPLLLTIICNVHCFGKPLPKHIGLLYNEICDVLLRRYIKIIENYNNIKLNLEQVKEICQLLAYHIMNTKEIKISSIKAIMVITAYIKSISTTLDVEKILDVIGENSGLLIKNGDNYEFLHKSFLKFLAAQYIIKTKKKHVLLKRIKYIKWHKTIIFYILLENAESFLLDCLKSIKNLKPEILVFLIECLSNIKDLSTAVKEKIKKFLLVNTIHPDPRIRRNIGKALLRVRVNEMEKMRKGIIFDSSLITNIEYQVFLDEGIDKQRSYAPYHWHAYHYSRGEAHMAVVGLTPYASEAFCEWLGTRIACADKSKYKISNQVGVYNSNNVDFWIKNKKNTYLLNKQLYKKIDIKKMQQAIEHEIKLIPPIKNNTKKQKELYNYIIHKIKSFQFESFYSDPSFINLINSLEEYLNKIIDITKMHERRMAYDLANTLGFIFKDYTGISTILGKLMNFNKNDDFNNTPDDTSNTEYNPDLAFLLEEIINDSQNLVEKLKNILKSGFERDLEEKEVVKIFNLFNFLIHAIYISVLSKTVSNILRNFKMENSTLERIISFLQCYTSIEYPQGIEYGEEKSMLFTVYGQLRLSSLFFINKQYSLLASGKTGIKNCVKNTMKSKDKIKKIIAESIQILSNFYLFFLILECRINGEFPAYEGIFMLKEN